MREIEWNILYKRDPEKTDGWRRRFAWLPKDLNRINRDSCDEPFDLIWLKPYWERPSHRVTDAAKGRTWMEVERRGVENVTWIFGALSGLALAIGAFGFLYRTYGPEPVEGEREETDGP